MSFLRDSSPTNCWRTEVWLAIQLDRVADPRLKLHFEEELSSHTDRASSETLRQTWGLTPTEARLAKLLLEPLSLSDAARRLGIGRETARTHLKALFSKTQTRRQVELVIVLLSSRP